MSVCDERWPIDPLTPERICAVESTQHSELTGFAFENKIHHLMSVLFLLPVWYFIMIVVVVVVVFFFSLFI